MKKLIFLIVLFCTIFIGSCTTTKHLKDVLTGKAGLTEPFHLFQHYRIYAEKNKTEVEAMVYFSHYNQTGERIIPQKVLFNDSEMKQGLLETGFQDDFQCGESPKNIPKGEKFYGLPEGEIPDKKTPNEWDFYVKNDNYKVDNKILVYKGNEIYGEYKVNFEPAMIINPESIKLSRSKENTIKLQNIIKYQPNIIEKNENLSFYISQQNGVALNQNELKYDVSSNSIIIPIEASKKLNPEKATIVVRSMRIGKIKNPEVSTNSYTITYTDKNCVDVID